MRLGSRKGVASVVGTVIFVVVFMLALGTLEFVSELQAQGAHAEVGAESLVAAKGAERLSFTGGGGGILVENGGGAGVDVNHLILMYPNGTVYTPAVSADVPAGGGVSLASLVPSGACLPGTSTCQARYDSIVSGAAPGGAVGVLSSLGNTFWYYPAEAPSGASPSYYRAPSVESTTSTAYVGVPGLGFQGAPGASYVVQVYVGFWQSGPTSNPAMFAISVPPGAAFMFCGGLYWSSAGTGNQAPYNLCTSSSGTTIGPTENYGGSCTSAYLGCELVGTAFVTFASGGTFQLEFEGMTSGAANVFADSLVVVTPQG
ncbi:MAG: hypothetical protein JRN57_02605 [Nitrososphaerota archaeon]|nr:hypothetical protein [Nitrososphaerota archaeon]